MNIYVCRLLPAYVEITSADKPASPHVVRQGEASQNVFLPKGGGTSSRKMYGTSLVSLKPREGETYVSPSCLIRNFLGIIKICKLQRSLC